MHWSDARGSIRENAHNRIHIKTLPGRRRGHRGRLGGGGVGRRGQHRGHRWRRRGLNEASRKKVAGLWGEAGWKDAQIDGGCRCRGSCRGRRDALSLWFSDERWPFLDEDRRKDESRLTFFRKLVEVLHHVSTLGEHALHAVFQLQGSLCFLARVVPGGHGANKLGSMG